MPSRTPRIPPTAAAGLPSLSRQHRQRNSNPHHRRRRPRPLPRRLLLRPRAPQQPMRLSRRLARRSTQRRKSTRAASSWRQPSWSVFSVAWCSWPLSWHGAPQDRRPRHSTCIPRPSPPAIYRSPPPLLAYPRNGLVSQLGSFRRGPGTSQHRSTSRRQGGRGRISPAYILHRLLTLGWVGLPFPCAAVPPVPESGACAACDLPPAAAEGGGPALAAGETGSQKHPVIAGNGPLDPGGTSGDASLFAFPDARSPPSAPHVRSQWCRLAG